MSFPSELDGLIPAQRHGDGPDCARTGPTLDGLPAVDDRGWVRVVSADLDMGAWSDPIAGPHEAEPYRP